MQERSSFENESRGVTSPVAGVSEPEEIPGIGQYDDFQTIDWQRDLARDRMHHRYITKRREVSVLAAIKAAHDAWSGWVCVLSGIYRPILVSHSLLIMEIVLSGCRRGCRSLFYRHRNDLDD